MAVRAYRDGRGRSRYLVEFKQSGVRVLRRLHPGATRGDATALETKLRGEVFRQVKLGEVPEISLEEAIARWLRDTLPHKKDQRGPLSKAHLLGPFVRGKTLRQAPEAAREALSTWSGAPTSSALRRDTATRDAALSPATINRRLCILKATLKHAWKQGWIADNLSGRISLLPEENKREVYLTRAQVRTLALSSPSSASKAAIMLAAYTGLRASELLHLTAQHSSGDGLMVIKTKTGRSRVVPVASPARRYLSALPLGFSYSQLRKEFLQARQAANMEHVRFHDLRHTCASWLINAGVDLYTVGAILGHSAPITTARYAHLAQKTLKRAMGRLK